MTGRPIVKVYDASGRLIHSCAELGCSVSWDGYVIADGYTATVPDPANAGATVEIAAAKGDRVQGASDPGLAWDTSRPGEAHRLG